MMERKGIKISTSGEELASNLKYELEKRLNVTVCWESEFDKIVIIIVLKNTNYRNLHVINRFEETTFNCVCKHYEIIKNNLINNIIYK